VTSPLANGNGSSSDVTGAASGCSSTGQRDPLHTCPTCWGKRVLLVQIYRPNGEMVHGCFSGEVCPQCLGVGSAFL
jgi:hypothetical protein